MPQECYNKKIVEDKLSKVFTLHGFSMVQTSSLEYFDLFNEIFDSKNINRMFKMTDNDGGLLVLRPDITLQICRMVATKFDINQINKLYYVENSFEYLPNTSTARSREFEQAGIEMLGKSGFAGDLEILTAAIEGFKACGLEDFLLEIGQVQFFNGLMQEGGVNSEDAKILRGLVNKKDMLGVELFLQNRNLKSEFIKKFLLLPTLFGDESILEKAKNMCSNDTSLKAIDNICYLVSHLKERGLDKYISIDLGMLQGDYYSGLVVRGVAKNLGLSILDGGRYDNLCNALNAPMEAVGFAIGVKRLLIALENQNKLEGLKAIDYAYISDDKFGDFEYETVKNLREGGKTVTKCFLQNGSELAQYCVKNNIAGAFEIAGQTRKDIKVGAK